MDNAVLRRPGNTRSSCYCSRPIRLLPTSGFRKSMFTIIVLPVWKGTSEGDLHFLSLRVLLLESSKFNCNLWVKGLILLNFVLCSRFSLMKKWTLFSLIGA